MATKKNGTESDVVVSGGGEVALYDAETMAMIVGDDGHEGLESEDFGTPFLRVLQKTSPEVDRGGTSFIEGAEPGMFLNTGNRKIYETVSFLPVSCQKAWIEWIPYESGGGLVRQYDRGERPPQSAGQIVVNLANGNEVLLTHNHFGFAIDEDGNADEVVFTCSRTQFTPSKKLNAALKQSKMGGKPVKRYANLVTLGSERRENESGSWYRFTWDNVRILDFNNEGHRDLFAAARLMHQMVSAGELGISDAALHAAETSAANESITTPTEVVEPTEESSIPF